MEQRAPVPRGQQQLVSAADGAGKGIPFVAVLRTHGLALFPSDRFGFASRGDLAESAKTAPLAVDGTNNGAIFFIWVELGIAPGSAIMHIRAKPNCGRHPPMVMHIHPIRCVMPRPRKTRLIQGSALVRYYKPQGIPLSDLVETMVSLDGMEALRLADVEGLEQAEAAALMGISRSTFSRLLAEARGAVATALSRGWALRIDGGPVERSADVRGNAACLQRGGGGCRKAHVVVAAAPTPDDERT
jgi:predicted DNA-binding protein (UPF0251 family)